MEIYVLKQQSFYFYTVSECDGDLFYEVWWLSTWFYCIVLCWSTMVLWWGEGRLFEELRYHPLLRKRKNCLSAESNNICFQSLMLGIIFFKPLCFLFSSNSSCLLYFGSVIFVVFVVQIFRAEPIYINLLPAHQNLLPTAPMLMVFWDAGNWSTWGDRDSSLRLRTLKPTPLPVCQNRLLSTVQTLVPRAGMPFEALFGSC